MKKHISILFLLLHFIFFQTAQAQTHLGLGLQLGFPNNEFRENTKAVGAGFHLNALFPFAQTVPIYFGFGFGYMLYGSNSQTIQQNLNVYAGTQIISSIPVNLGVTTNNNMLNGNAILRFKAPLSIVQPYIDGTVGFNYIYTRTKITDNSPNRIFTNKSQNPDDNVINARTQIQSTVLTYGGGLGMMIKLGNTAALDIRATYLLGGEAEYYDRSQTQNWQVAFGGQSSTFDSNNPDNISLDPNSVAKKSKTDMIMVNFGLVFNLN